VSIHFFTLGGGKHYEVLFNSEAAGGVTGVTIQAVKERLRDNVGLSEASIRALITLKELGA
jgi:hypothetical protein